MNRHLFCSWRSSDRLLGLKQCAKDWDIQILLKRKTEINFVLAFFFFIECIIPLLHPLTIWFPPQALNLYFAETSISQSSHRLGWSTAWRSNAPKTNGKQNCIFQALTWCLVKLFDTMGCVSAGEKCSCAKRNVPKLLLAFVKAECLSSSECSEYLVTNVDEGFLSVTALEGVVLSKCLIHRLDPYCLIMRSEGDF